MLYANLEFISDVWKHWELKHVIIGQSVQEQDDSALIDRRNKFKQMII